MTEKLEPDEKTIASLNASLEKCWNDAENPLPYIPLVVPPIEVPEFNFFGNGKEWHTEKKDEYTPPYNGTILKQYDDGRATETSTGDIMGR